MVMQAPPKEEQAKLCPDCGVSYEALTDCLQEGYDSDNFWQAIYIIMNCQMCQMKFAGKVK